MDARTAENIKRAAAGKPIKCERRVKVTQALLGLPNADKAFHEKWHARRQPGSLPHPFRAILAGVPNSGKSNLAKHLAFVWPETPFERVVVWHCSPELSKEWQHDGVEVTGDCPALDSWDPEVRNLLIIDDVALNKLRGDDATTLDRLFGFASTHSNLSIIGCFQRSVNCPINVRQMANVHVVWPQVDTRTISLIASITGLKREVLETLFEHCEGAHDHLMIDRTSGTPYPLRFNSLQPMDETGRFL